MNGNTVTQRNNVKFITIQNIMFTQTYLDQFSELDAELMFVFKIQNC